MLDRNLNYRLSLIFFKTKLEDSNKIDKKTLCYVKQFKEREREREREKVYEYLCKWYANI